MLTINLRDAKAGFSSLVDEAVKGEIVTITRHGKPVAALVSVEAAEIARKALTRKRAGPCQLSQDVPRRRVPAQPQNHRGMSSSERLPSRYQRRLHAGGVEVGSIR